MSRRRLLIVTVVAMVSSAAQADVLFVDDDAAPPGDGLSWGTAYRYLQDALAFASDPTNAITEISVGQGVYRPDERTGSTCCEGNSGPGCDTPECEDTVCSELPTCCDNTWDDICGLVAGILCPELCDESVDLTSTFQLIDGVALAGGYAGVSAPDPDLRNVEAFVHNACHPLTDDDEGRPLIPPD